MRRIRAPASADRGALLAILLATLLGGGCRLATVRWGEPFLFHPDERGFVMWEAASIEWRGLRRGDFRPRTTTYGPVIYELALLVKWTVLDGLEGSQRDVARYRDEWSYTNAAIAGAREGEPFSLLDWTIAVRTAGALASTLAIGLLGLAGLRLGGPRAGAVLAWLAAPSVGLVQASHFATTDSLVLAEIAALLHACAMLARGGRSGAAAYAGVCLGLVAATKTSGLVLLAAVPVAIALSSGAASLGGTVRALATARFGVAVGVGIAVYALLCPWGVFDRAAYDSVAPHLSGTAVLLTQYTDRDYGFYDWRFPYNDTTPYLYLLPHVLGYAVGLPVLVAGGVGLASAWRRSAGGARLAAAAALPTFALVGLWGVKTIRYSLPLVPGLLLGAALLLAGAVDRGGWRRALALAVLGAGLVRGLAFAGMFLEPDPRVLAGRWVRERALPGEVVVVEPEGSYTAPLGTNDDGVGQDDRAGPPLEIRRLWQHRPADVAAHVDALLGDARFVVVGELYRRRGMHPSAWVRAPSQARFYQALFAEETGFVRVATFDRAPQLGPLRWDERDDEPFAIAFDHMPVYVFERRGPYRSPFTP